MRGILLIFLATSVGTTILNDQEPRIKRADNEESFEEALKEGNKLLRNEVNADDTMEFLRKLHSMESEIMKEHMDSSKPSADVLNELKSFGGKEKSHVQLKGGETIEEINTRAKVAPALFQGDIILTKQQADEILEDVKANEGTRKKRQAFRDQNYPNTTWPDGISFTFYNASVDGRRLFMKAAALWAWETCINFGQSNSAKNKVVVLEAAGCWSHIGRIGGDQGLSLGAGCEELRIAAHEIGHAIGLYHTHSRHDRDNFVSIDFSNIKPGWESQFVKQTEATNYNYNLTYDYGSLMHYGPQSSSANGEPFMWPTRDRKFMASLGSPFISFYDKLMVNLHYGCLEKCAKYSTKCENGGFPHPRDCNKCSCPSGYGGRLCNERPPGCGETLTATKEFQTLTDLVGQWDYHPDKINDDFYMCNYWITAPPGSTIEVVLANYSQHLDLEGCSYAGVEVKTLPDKRHTGYKFCALEQIGTSLISAHNIVPVITYSRVYEARSVLKYRIASSNPNPSETTTQPETTAQPDTTTEPETTAQPVTTSQPKEITSEPIDVPTSGCKAPIMCTILVKFGLCSSSSYDAEFKEKFCPGSCT